MPARELQESPRAYKHFRIDMIQFGISVYCALRIIVTSRRKSRSPLKISQFTPNSSLYCKTFSANWKTIGHRALARYKKVLLTSNVLVYNTTQFLIKDGLRLHRQPWRCILATKLLSFAPGPVGAPWGDNWSDSLRGYSVCCRAVILSISWKETALKSKHRNWTPWGSPFLTKIERCFFR